MEVNSYGLIQELLHLPGGTKENKKPHDSQSLSHGVYLRKATANQ
jgi:hypothetical protein